MIFINMNIIINGVQSPLSIISNKFQLEKGLKGKSEINGCYLFVLNNDLDKKHSFWMQGVLVPLDIVFCIDKKIVKIFHNCPPCKEFSSQCELYTHEGNYVLELPGGFCKKNQITEGNDFQVVQ
jgi:uncharacterized membrane protein (UPF0127 family)